MKQLVVKDLLDFVDKLKEDYPEEEVLEMPIYLGDDDELNGIHCGWCYQEVDLDNEDDDWIVEMINENPKNIKLENKGILIS